MRTLYLSCEMGAAGDMLMAALYELLPDQKAFLDTMNGLGIPGVTVAAEPSVKCGVTGTHMAVSIHGAEEAPDGETSGAPHAHSHRDLLDIKALIASLPLPHPVKEDAIAVYDAIALAESRVHGQPVGQVHFHEVGALDAVADVVGVCLAMSLLAPDRVLCSPVHVGAGQVRCAHGLVPVPAPATALLLEGVPIYGGSIRSELCTPTGAALLRHFASSFGPLPPLRLEKTGYGMGKKEFEACNCVRALLGREEEAGDAVLELRCNLDDMTPEALGFAQERLWEAGALDVYTAAVGMKKNRPGVLLVCLCHPAQREALLTQLFRHTTTLGVRELRCARSVLTRRVETVDTAVGPVRVKSAQGWGAEKRKAEYEDLARIARARGLTLDEARRLAE